MVVINQLFRCKPPVDLVYRYAHLFGLSGLSDKSLFGLQDMKRHNTVNRIKRDMIPDLKSLYIDCKAGFLTDINDRTAITVFRQLLRPLGLRLDRTHATVDSKRVTLYQLTSHVDET